MLEFKKYSSIENSFNREFMERIVAEMPTDLEYVVQEKVHGANTSFLCDGENVRFAKRTSMLEAEEKGVCYTPEHEFYGFDIYVMGEGVGRYLPVDEVNELFDKHGFFYARTLFKGTLAECLKHPNAFQSKIAEWLGFPAIEDNICEGIVIRPVVPMYLRNGSRVLIKSKNERFVEKKSVKKRNKLFAETVPYSEALKALVPEVEAYVTEQRLANVVSHIGEVHVPKDFGKIMGLFSKDVLEDFLKEQCGEYGCLEKSEQKLLNKELNKLSTELVKKVYMNPAYILD